ncbi:DUF3515 domain-containing protein [Corynebacterium meitnerae]|uniref:DUF3515 domain-containing protein n=1 Tax=Corynebacterium meitnerae TaxID=2913498 RepID=A0A9X3RI23_9CORY|nr:DUF3515 domain-containing protein [Corynebacterium meitnerae]MCZ9292894.1 DUF3515 domain-containing protein [Corynebacterium meitnerae]
MSTANTHTDSSPNEPINRSLVYISLGLALLLVIGVLAGSKFVLSRTAQQPVTLSPLPAPMADSPECAALVDQLPEKLVGHKRTPLADPAPAGAAVWQSSTTERVTLRCGVDMPLQYTKLTPTFTAAGAEWIKVTDPTGTGLATWFTVDRSPVIAVTAESEALGRNDNPVEGLNLGAAKGDAATPARAPLAAVEDAPEFSSHACNAFMAALPEELTEGYTPIEVGDVQGYPKDRTKVWGGDGLEPIVVRCGVKQPDSYAPGAVLTQVNEIPWFEDEAAAEDPETSGGLATTLYALGREANIAISLPAGLGDEALNTVSAVITSHVPERK